MLEDAARARLRVRVHGQLGQPRRGARPAHPGLDARGADPVPDGGHRPHGGRPQGRPPRAPARATAGSCCARPRRRPTRTSRRCRTSRRHRFVNTNNLWIDLRALDAAMRERDGVLGLPMIRNQKTVDPSDKSSPAVYQTRDRDGRGDRGLRGRPRAARPAHALRARQDHRRPARAALGRLPADRRRARRAGRRTHGAPFVTLDPDHFKLLRDFEERFPTGPPSLVECERFEVEGDVHFGAGVVARGEVIVHGPATIEDGTPSSLRRGGRSPRPRDEHQREDQADPDPGRDGDEEHRRDPTGTEAPAVLDEGSGSWRGTGPASRAGRRASGRGRRGRAR